MELNSFAILPYLLLPHSPMWPYILWTKGIPLEILKKWHNAIATDNHRNLALHVDTLELVAIKKPYKE